MPKKKPEIPAQPPIVDGKDYYFYTLAGPILIDSGLISFLESDITNKWGTGFLEALNKDLPKFVMPFGEDYTSPYAVNGTSPKRTTVSKPKVQAELQEGIKLAGNYLNQISKVEKLQNYPAISHYLDLVSSFFDSELNGGDKWKYASRLPSITDPLACVDWTDKMTNGKTATAADLNKMLTDLRFPELWHLLDLRISTEAELDGADLGEPEKAEIAGRLQEINNKQIEIYEHLIDPKNKELFTCWTKGGYEMNVIGDRGYPSMIQALKAENQALQNGWDPRKISELHTIQGVAKNSATMADQLEGTNKKIYQPVVQKLRKLAAFDPLEKTFANQAEFDAYTTRFALEFREAKSLLQYPKIVNELKKDKELNLVHPAELFCKRFEETVKRNDALKQVEYEDTITALAKDAVKKYNELTALDGKANKRSPLYNNMKKALIDVAELGKYPPSLNKINQKLEKLAQVTEEYSRARSGMLKHGDGKRRVQMADSLNSLAQTYQKKFAELSKVCPAAKFPSMGVDEVHIRTKMKSDEDLVEELRDFKKTQGKMLNAFASGAQAGMNKISQFLKNLDKDADKREKNKEKTSESYDNLIRAVRDLQKQRCVLDSNPDQLLRSMKNAVQASVDYVKEHTGRHILSGKKTPGIARINNAADIANTLMKYVNSLTEYRKNLPDFEPGETLGWKDPDLYNWHNFNYDMIGSHKKSDSISIQNVQQRLEDTILMHQYRLFERVPGEPKGLTEAENQKAFADQKDDLKINVLDILTAQFMEHYLDDVRKDPEKAGKKINQPAKAMEDIHEQIKNYPPFKRMMDSVQTWQDLEDLRDKAIYKDGNMLYAELAKNRGKQAEEDKLKSFEDIDLKKNVHKDKQNVL